MGWRGILREMQAASRRSERAAYRRRRILEKQTQQYERMLESEQVRHEVELYENHIELLISVHTECGSAWDWHAIQTAQPPTAPAKGDRHEQRAQRALASYKPGIWDWFFARGVEQRAELQEAIKDARREDKLDYQKAVGEYQSAKVDWENSRHFAARILKGDMNAYGEAIRETSPFRDMAILGSSIEFTFPNPKVIQAELHVNGEKAVPSEIKSQLKTGKLSVKPMPRTRFYEIYQDYLCGCVLRVARELFALLPVNMVIVTALGEILNTQTGHLEQKAVLSVAVPRDTLKSIQWDRVDPSDTMRNFVHRMNFKRAQGMLAVEPIRLSELQM